MAPTLVLLPGMDGTGDLFAPLVAALGPHMRTIIVRYPDEPLDYASHEEIARAALPLGHPFILLGESFPDRSRFRLRLLLQGDLEATSCAALSFALHVGCFDGFGRRWGFCPHTVFHTP